MNNKFWRFVRIFFVIVFTFYCGVVSGVWIKKKQMEIGTAEVEHIHGWDIWQPGVWQGDHCIQFRRCTNCGLGEMRIVNTVR
jgi:hypothetical protein